MLLLLVGAGVLYFLLAEPLDGVILMSFVVVVIAISLYQEHKTENALTALRDLSSPRALVIRDGHQQRIAGRDVVRGDVVLLVEGDRVPADGVLIDCSTSRSTKPRSPGRPSLSARRPLAPAPPRRRWARRAATPHPGCSPARSWSRAAASRLSATPARTRRSVASGTRCATSKPSRTPLQRELARFVRIIAVCGLVAAALVVLRVRTHPARLAGRSPRRDRRRHGDAARGDPGRPHRLPRARRLAHVPTSRPHPPRRRHRDPRIRHRDLRRQDRHPDAQLDGCRLT